MVVTRKGIRDHLFPATSEDRPIPFSEKYARRRTPIIGQIKGRTKRRYLINLPRKQVGSHISQVEPVFKQRSGQGHSDTEHSDRLESEDTDAERTDGDDTDAEHPEVKRSVAKRSVAKRSVVKRSVAKQNDAESYTKEQTDAGHNVTEQTNTKTPHKNSCEDIYINRMLPDFPVTEQELSLEMSRFIQYLVRAQVSLAVYDKDVWEPQFPGTEEQVISKLLETFRHLVRMEVGSYKRWASPPHSPMTVLSRSTNRKKYQNCELVGVLQDLIRKTAEQYKDTLKYQLELGNQPSLDSAPT
ncbi:uncharacterized protein B0I36DRAFT_352565 [Microdochium trichocladiopsis]|uniref:Uncharacterized protein n=1 Tax=Microdochium trichocladiopsis TaxID=1682393 RepID=A0A9P8XYB3_9PEZI|nr:uncharacterized protein B0I36DRAFT_352565 [Microdochium trichocladiopsis]KAH7024315.1 hypothetical protein B0I36DRAFT_352565 [Microdochium trichocladiopsis]